MISKISSHSHRDYNEVETRRVAYPAARRRIGTITRFQDVQGSAQFLDKHVQYLSKTGTVLTWCCAAKEALYPLKGGETTRLMRYGSAWCIESFASNALGLCQ
jgi:hypothetical protein